VGCVGFIREAVHEEVAPEESSICFNVYLVGRHDAGAQRLSHGRIAKSGENCKKKSNQKAHGWTT
jgi:hypothetical protein